MCCSPWIRVISANCWTASFTSWPCYGQGLLGTRTRDEPLALNDLSLPPHEDRQFLRRTEATQRLQGGRRLRGSRVAHDSGGIDFSSRVQRAAMGYANCPPHLGGWVSHCAGVFVGVRDQTRGN